MERIGVGLGCALLTLVAWTHSVTAADYDPARAASEIMPQAPRALVLDVTRTDSAFLAIGERGHLLRSTDGVDWTQVPMPTRSDLTSLAARGSRVLVVGHDQVILASIDGGLSFELQHVDTTAAGPLLSALFLDDERAIAIGAYGQYCQSDDLRTWSCELISDRKVEDRRPAARPVAEEEDEELYADTDIGEESGDPHLNDVVLTDRGTLLIVGEKGNLYRSSDGGQSWLRTALSYKGSMFGVVALDDGHLIAHGLRGHAFLSDDDGVTWRELSTGTDQSLIGAAALSGGRAILVGGNGTVLLRRAGSTELIGLQYPAGGLLAAVTAISDTRFVLAGENGLGVFEPGK